MKVTKTKTKRGFALLKFKDQYGVDCSLQKSSLATKDCIWLGTEKDRMHLSQSDCKKLIRHLERFVVTGEL